MQISVLPGPFRLCTGLVLLGSWPVLSACHDGEGPGADASGAGAAGETFVAAPSSGGVADNPPMGTAGTGGSETQGSLTCPTEEEARFSFFLTSQAALIRESGSPDGFGGDLGGLSGADAICQRIAESVSPCQRGKTWRAFLSTPTTNARDRIGTGPWHDRLGRLLAANLDDLLNERPTGADPLIVNDFPNENGVPNHDPDGRGLVDNHQILTGTGLDGTVYQQGAAQFAGSATACGTANGAWSVEAATCWGWTTKEPKGCPRVGHSWPRDLSGRHWISVWNEGGCAPGGGNLNPANLFEDGMDGTPTVGSAGGYGGFYCFAVTGA